MLPSSTVKFRHFPPPRRRCGRGRQQQECAFHCRRDFKDNAPSVSAPFQLPSAASEVGVFRYHKSPECGKAHARPVQHYSYYSSQLPITLLQVQLPRQYLYIFTTTRHPTATTTLHIFTLIFFCNYHTANLPYQLPPLYTGAASDTLNRATSPP